MLKRMLTSGEVFITSCMMLQGPNSSLSLDDLKLFVFTHKGSVEVKSIAATTAHNSFRIKGEIIPVENRVYVKKLYVKR